MSTRPRLNEEREIPLSQIEAQQIRRWRRARKRKELARLLLWAVGTFLFLYLTLWILFGQ